MKPEIVLAFEFVEFIPDELEERTLYISIPYCTAVHKCFCRCGREVVTPLSPTAWQLIFDCKTVSLYPSIGSWSLPCQSHYFITKSTVVWAPKWSDKRIAKGREREAIARERYCAGTVNPTNAATTPSPKSRAKKKKKKKDKNL
jgi:hypothetical protein